MLKYSLLTDTCGHASWLTLGDQTFVVRTLNQTISRVLSLNASDQPSQLLTALVKTRTFVRVQSKVSKQTKHVHMRKLKTFHLVSLFWKFLEK